MQKLGWANDTRRLGDLVDWERNPRHITDAQAERLERSLDEFGQVQTVAIEPDNTLVDGHQRAHVWAAAQKYGADYEVDVRVASRKLTDAEREALIAALHGGAAGQWDWDALSSFDFGTLQEWGFNEALLEQWNDDAAELAKMLESEEEEPPEDPGAQVDRAEELREKWDVRSGDLWGLGEHRLVCGDCTDAATVERVMDGERALLMVTDPPYGVSYASKNEFLNSIDKGNRIQSEIHGDHKTPEEMSAFWIAAFSTIRQFVEDGASYYVTGPQGGDLLFLLLALKESGFPLRHMLIWAKNNHVLGRSDYHYKHEPIIYGWVDGAGHSFYGAAGEVSLWEIPRPQQSKSHPTEKPLELYERAINNSSEAGDIIIEPFAGSGTGVVACERLGRKCRAVEVAPKYCAVTLERWHQMTGEEPVLLERLE